jgi:hypothetical protein
MNLSVSDSSHVNIPVAVAPDPRAGDFKVAAVLGAAGAAGTALTMPYSHALLPDMPYGGIIVGVGAALQGSALLLLAWAGLRMGRSLGLDMPWLRARLEGRAAEVGARGFAASAAIGAVLAGLCLLLARFVPPPAVAPPHVARWMGALASLGAPFTEEILCRLFAMTAVTWVVSKVAKSRRGGVYFFGNAVAAIGFAALHLPQAIVVYGAPSFALIAFIFAANGLVGMACGYLFWRKGLGHAIAAHMGADLVLHALFTC